MISLQQQITSCTHYLREWSSHPERNLAAQTVESIVGQWNVEKQSEQWPQQHSKPTHPSVQSAYPALSPHCSILSASSLWLPLVQKMLFSKLMHQHCKTQHCGVCNLQAVAICKRFFFFSLFFVLFFLAYQHDGVPSCKRNNVGAGDGLWTNGLKSTLGLIYDVEAPQCCTGVCRLLRIWVTRTRVE